MTEKEKQQREEKIFMRVLGIFVVFLLVFIPVRYVYRGIQSAKAGLSSYELGDDFDENKLSFLFIAKKALDFFDEVKAENPHVEEVNIERHTDTYPPSVDDPTNWRWEIYYEVENGQYQNTYIYENMSEIEFLAYRAVSDAFSKHSLMTVHGLMAIVARDDEVSFIDYSGYRIIYTENFKWRPKHMPENSYVERIDLKWFQCV